MIRLTEEQFTEFKRFTDIEVFSEQEIIKAMNLSKIEKSSFDELNDDEKEVFKGVVDEFSTFKKIVVLSPQPEGSMNRGSISTSYYVRPTQVEWTEEEIVKSIDGEDVIEKARSGIYKDTAENKKLGRVGQKFGSKKVKEERVSDKNKFEGSEMSRREVRKKLFDMDDQSKEMIVNVGDKKYSGTVKEIRDKLFNETGKDEDVKQNVSIGEKMDFRKEAGLPPKKEEISEAQKKFQGDVASGKDNLKEMVDRGNKISKDDIKSVNLSGVTQEYGGGYSLNVTMKDGSKHLMRLSKKENASLKNSPMQHADIKKDRGMWEFAVEKINSGNYDKVEKE